MRLFFLIVVLLILATPLASALTPGTEVVVPAGARGQGAGGSVWQMDLFLLNPGAVDATAQVTWLERNHDNSNADSTEVNVGAGQEVVLEDVIGTLVGLASGGGAFRITSGAPIAVNSRIYNLQGASTFGQGFEGLTAADKASAEGSSLAWVAGPQQSGANRSNLFAAADATGASFSVEARNPAGDVLGSRSYTVPAWGAFFAPLTDVVTGDPGDMTLKITVESGGAWFAGSRIDGSTGDPFTLAAAVVADSGLNVEAYAGTYFGSWENTTFGSSGDATMVVAVDTGASGIDLTIDLDGFVFGASDPPAESFSGMYDADGFTVTGSSVTFGDVTLSVDTSGELTGTGINVPNPGIDRVEFQGSASPEEISTAYTVFFAGSNETATGVMNLSKQ